MKTALGIIQKCCRAAFYHYIKTSNDDPAEQHKFCPTTNDTWCSYQKGQINSNSNNSKRQNKHHQYLDPVSGDVLEQMINKLTSKLLLRRCLRATTQNSNESLNSIVW